MVKIRFKDIPVEERPRERLIMYGANNLSNEELLMIILKTGTKNYSGGWHGSQPDSDTSVFFWGIECEPVLFVKSI